MDKLPIDAHDVISKFLRPDDFYRLRATEKAISKWNPDLIWSNVKTKDAIRTAIVNRAQGAARWLMLNRADFVLDIDIATEIYIRNLEDLEVMIYRFMRHLVPELQYIANSAILSMGHANVLRRLISDGAWARSDTDTFNIVVPHELIEWDTSQKTDWSTKEKMLDMLPYVHVETILQTSISGGGIDMFRWCMKRKKPDETLLDHIYINKMWDFMSIVFTVWPRVMTEYIFGDYDCAMDPQMVADLAQMADHLTSDAQQSLLKITEMYYIYLWRHLSHKRSTLQSIMMFDQTRLSGEWSPDDFLENAVASPWIEYMKYLIVQGLEITHKDYKAAAQVNPSVALVMWDAIVTQESHRIIMVMIFLAVCIIAFIISKIENRADNKCRNQQYATPIF